MTAPTSPFTEKQGEYLALIHAYVVLNGRAPAETDMQRFFRVTPLSVHSMVIELERRGLISRTPREARCIALLVDPADLPPLRQFQPIKTSVTRY